MLLFGNSINQFILATTIFYSLFRVQLNKKTTMYHHTNGVKAMMIDFIHYLLCMTIYVIMIKNVIYKFDRKETIVLLVMWLSIFLLGITLKVCILTQWRNDLLGKSYGTQIISLQPEKIESTCFSKTIKNGTIKYGIPLTILIYKLLN